MYWVSCVSAGSWVTGWFTSDALPPFDGCVCVCVCVCAGVGGMVSVGPCAWNTYLAVCRWWLCVLVLGDTVWSDGVVPGPLMGV